MITEARSTVPNTKVLRREPRLKALLPWIIAGGVLLAYLVTLNRWISFSSLGIVARISGWTWQPEIWPFTRPQPAPVYWLLTYPFRWLPASSIPIALNLFSALLATLCLGFLARSVMLLPHDRTHAQRLREKSEFSLLSLRGAWLAPTLAVLVCGLQLTFWEHATAASQDMLNLLLFAYVIRALLEFRIDGRQSWLSRAAFIYGLGITNDWAFIGFFPLFIAAVVWIKGLGFFDLRFLGRMCAWGMLGLLVYLLLPITQSLSSITPVPFWTALRANVGAQKLLLSTIFTKQMLIHADKPLWVLGIFALLPLIVMSVRWPSYFGDTSALGVTIAAFSFHLVHAILLMLCVWVALDPAMSPRLHVAEAMRPWLPMLTFYYLGALGVGYFCGYFLLVLGKRIERPRRNSAGLKSSEGWLIPATTVVVVLLGCVLAGRNLPQIRTTNGAALKNFAQLLADSLPSEPAIILSDDPRRLVLLQSVAAQRGNPKDMLLVDTTSLKWAEYRQFLKMHHPKGAEVQAAAGNRSQVLEDGAVLELVWNLSESNSLYYLHPSFGYFFERFYAEPHGLAYKLTRYPAESLLPPPIAPDTLDKMAAFRQQAEETTFQRLKPFLDSGPRHRPLGRFEAFLARLHLPHEANRDMSTIAGFCSRALNCWGAEAQKAQNLALAHACFQGALEMNPDNRAARVNLEFNTDLQAGKPIAAQVGKPKDDELGKYRKWDQLMNADGPFDEPNRCFDQGQVFVRSGLYRQAAQQFDRVIALNREHVRARLILAQLYLNSRVPDRALDLLNEIRSLPPAISLARSNQTELLYLEMSLRLLKRDPAAADTVLSNALKLFPGDEELLMTGTRVFMSAGHFTNAITALDRQLQLTPTNLSALINKAYALMQFQDFEHAVVQLNKALSLEPTNTSALFNRSICYLQLNQLPEAQHSYEQLLKTYPTSYPILFGLHEIAWRRQDTNSAIRYAEMYLTNSPPENAEEAKMVRGRLTQLTSGR